MRNLLKNFQSFFFNNKFNSEGAFPLWRQQSHAFSLQSDQLHRNLHHKGNIKQMLTLITPWLPLGLDLLVVSSWSCRTPYCGNSVSSLFGNLFGNAIYFFPSLLTVRAQISRMDIIHRGQRVLPRTEQWTPCWKSSVPVPPMRITPPDV